MSIMLVHKRLFDSDLTHLDLFTEKNLLLTVLSQVSSFSI